MSKDNGKTFDTSQQILDECLYTACKGKQLQAQLDTAKEEIEELRNALIGHRGDLHCRSQRPCPTCRKSAKALGIKVPGQCARIDWDTQALERE